MKTVTWSSPFSAEKTWNRKLLSDTKEKKLDIDGGDLGGKLRVRILPKTVQHQQGFVWWVIQINIFSFIIWFETQSDQWLSYSLFSVEALVWSSRQRGTILNQILDNFKGRVWFLWFVIGCLFFYNWSCSIIFMYSTVS